MTTELDLGLVAFDPTGETDALDGILDLVQTDDLPSDLLATQFSPSEVDLSAAAPVPIRDSSIVAEDLEHTFLGLLADGQRNLLISIGSNSPFAADGMSDTQRKELQQDYALACTHNPALKWYGKLAQLLSDQQFGLEGEQLVLTLTPVQVEKILRPFAFEFRGALREESPLVSIVLDLFEQCDQRRVAASEAAMAADIKRRAADEPGLQPDQCTFDGLADPTQADLRLEEDLFGGDMLAPDTAKLDISMADLSNKAVAEYLVQQDTPAEQLAAVLAEQGFPKARSNEISTIVRFMRLNEKLSAQRNPPTGNIGAGSVNFQF